MRKNVTIFLIFTVLSFALVVGAIFAPFEKIYELKNNLFYRAGKVSSLKVYSLGGEMEVFVDNEAKGTVSPDMPFLDVFPIDRGEHTVRLLRKSSNEGFYKEFEKRIWFEEGFDVIVSCEIGPSLDSSFGWMLYAKKANDGIEGVVRLHLKCNTRDCIARIDEKESFGDGEEYLMSLDSQHYVNVKASGYQGIEFQLLPNEEEARRLISGYDLYLEVNLYRLPI